MIGAGRRALVGAALAGGSYLAVRSARAGRFDAALVSALTSPQPRRADPVVAVATDLGSSFGLAGVAASLAVSGRRRAASRVAFAGGLAWLLAQGVKPVLGRARPYELGTSPRLVSPPAGSSWPSGHAAVATAMAAALTGRTERRAAAAMSVLAAGVGASRVVVGVHHASDVVAGVGVGLVAADAGNALLARLASTRR